MSNDLSAQLAAHFQQTENSEPQQADTYGELTALITKVTGVAEGLERDAALSDIGVDSLDLIELAVRVEERFGVRVDGSVALQWETIGDVVAFIDAAPGR